jgi:hypothetical protein
VGWIADLEPGDLIAYSLQTITAGDATWVTLTLPIRRLDVTSTSTTTVVDSFSDEVTTTDGDTIVLRS